MAAVALLVLLAMAIENVAIAAFVDDLPGWMGETDAVSLSTKMNAMPPLVQAGKVATKIDPTKVVQLSWSPRAFLYKEFLSGEECAHLIQLAKDKLEKSMVVDSWSGKSFLSLTRTSSGMFISKGKDPIVASIEERIAAWTFLPKENGEVLQVLRYQYGEKYEPHCDYFQDKENRELGGYRIATVLMYLAKPEKGGETVFPRAQDSEVKDHTWSECAKQGLAVKPERGDALLFFNLHPDGVPDTASLHGGCPVIEGEKWSATKWIHVRSLERPRL